MFIVLFNMQKFIDYLCFVLIYILSRFALIHMDLWGLAPILSTTGARYFLLLIDDFSWFSWLHPLHNKDQALPTFIKFKALVENQFNSYRLCLLSDNNGEFRAFTSYLANHGVQHSCSCPKTP